MHFWRDFDVEHYRCTFCLVHQSWLFDYSLVSSNVCFHRRGFEKIIDNANEIPLSTFLKYVILIIVHEI